MSNSSLARAFTKRSKRPEISAPMPYREGQVKYAAGTIQRGKISAPMGLISTTNMLAYNAPDLPSASSSSSSLRSGDDSDVALTPTTTASSVTSPSVMSPVTPSEGPEPNPLSSYFPKRAATVTSDPRSSTSSSSGTDAPAVPKRAHSHTKKSHQELARQRSQARMSPPPNSLRSVRSSQDFFQPLADPSSHPFGRELEQVNEVAEDFGGARVVLDEEEQILRRKGLRKFSVDDYLCEIQELYGSIFDDRLGPLGHGAWL